MVIPCASGTFGFAGSECGWTLECAGRAHRQRPYRRTFVATFLGTIIVFQTGHCDHLGPQARARLWLAFVLSRMLLAPSRSTGRCDRVGKLAAPGRRVECECRCGPAQESFCPLSFCHTPPTADGARIIIRGRRTSTRTTTRRARQNSRTRPIPSTIPSPLNHSAHNHPATPPAADGARITIRGRRTSTRTTTRRACEEPQQRPTCASRNAVPPSANICGGRCVSPRLAPEYSNAAQPAHTAATGASVRFGSQCARSAASRLRDQPQQRPILPRGPRTRTTNEDE